MGPVIEQWAFRGMAGEGARGTAWICPPLPPTSPDCNTQGPRRRTTAATACGLESRIEISPSDEPRTSPGGERSLREGRSLWMKQVTPASDVPLSLSQRPMSCWAASTTLKRTGRSSIKLLPDNSPTGRPKLAMPHHRPSDRQRVFWVLMLARFHSVLGTV